MANYSEKVPQLVESTGISADYWNEYLPKACFLRKGMSKVKGLIRESPIQKYEERFPVIYYNDVINEFNEDRICRLNELSEIVNNFAYDSFLLDQNQFKRIVNEVHNLIYEKGK
ncbi:MAG: hypothetical protein ACQESF_00345, partial [Nanobdellota archaeon]